MGFCSYGGFKDATSGAFIPAASDGRSQPPPLRRMIDLACADDGRQPRFKLTPWPAMVRQQRVESSFLAYILGVLWEARQALDVGERIAGAVTQHSPPSTVLAQHEFSVFGLDAVFEGQEVSRIFH